MSGSGPDPGQVGFAPLQPFSDRSAVLGANSADHLVNCLDDGFPKEVERKLAFGFEPMGEQLMKNLAEPILCYRVNLQATPPGAAERPPPVLPRLADKAAIAVLPLTNMSSDPEQEYFVDGLAEDLITDLSKIPGLLVIARNSSFAYKGKPIDIRWIAKDLGVRYVVEGSVRRAEARVRINVQLIDAADGTHLWADRFDRDLADVFLLQDEVVGRIVSALSAVLPSARPVARQRATNLEAYDLLVRGRVMVPQSAESNRAARPLLEKAIALDPDFADAHAWLAMCHHWAWTYWAEPPERHRTLSLEAARRAVLLDPENALKISSVTEAINPGGLVVPAASNILHTVASREQRAAPMSMLPEFYRATRVHSERGDLVVPARFVVVAAESRMALPFASHLQRSAAIQMPTGPTIIAMLVNGAAGICDVGQGQRRNKDRGSEFHLSPLLLRGRLTRLPQQAKRLDCCNGNLRASGLADSRVSRIATGRQPSRPRCDHAP
jgi:TolB-like protein